jgi:hypothetical protein
MTVMFSDLESQKFPGTDLRHAKGGQLAAFAVSVFEAKKQLSTNNTNKN